MVRRQDWKRCPSAWINAGGLKKFVWRDGGRSAHTSALMCLAVIIHHADDNGEAAVTYDAFTAATGLGRTLISRGLQALLELSVIKRAKKSRFYLEDYDEYGGWAKFPMRSMYQDEKVTLFQNLKRRQSVEMDALKLLFLFAACRDNSTNTANITYDRINELSGVARNKIQAALSLLAANFVVSVEARPSTRSEYGVHNAYRLRGIDSYNHRGTTARNSI